MNCLRDHPEHEIRCLPGSMTIDEARREKVTLNMSRALGHLVMSQFGISALPDVYAIELDTHESAIDSNSSAFSASHFVRPSAADALPMEPASSSSSSSSVSSTSSSSSSSFSAKASTSDRSVSPPAGDFFVGNCIANHAEAANDAPPPKKRGRPSRAALAEMAQSKNATTVVDHHSTPNAAIPHASHRSRMRVLDRFVVAASDGLWNVLGADRVADVLANTNTNTNTAVRALLAAADAEWVALNAPLPGASAATSAGLGKGESTGRGATTAAANAKIAAPAASRLFGDNITATVCRISLQ
jgi:hypothetical protein